MLTGIQYRILKWISSGSADPCSGTAYASASKIALLLGEELLRRARGKTIIDFGCGSGDEAIELARAGAKQVIGIDVREDVLETARANAVRAGVGNVLFSTQTTERADIVVSIDSFEHFNDPEGVLRTMNKLLKPTGEVMVSFGPTWYHPFGGHLFSVFPWAHLLFRESALIRWRSDFKPDGATRFSEVSGGLNRMTIARFEQLLKLGPLEAAALETVPIRGLRLVHNRLTREFTTAIVRCRLVPRQTVPTMST